MTNRRNIIEVNGKHYDAKTGALLSSTDVVASKAAKKPAVKPVAKTGVVMDGFHRSHHTVNAAHAIHSKTAKSQTLMRTVVKKPLTTKAIKRSAVALDSIQKPKRPSVPHTPIVAPVSPIRAIRAEHTERSSMISKFGLGTGPKVSTQSTYLAVKEAPAEIAHAISAPLQHLTNPFQAALDKAEAHTHHKPAKAKKHHKVAKKLGLSNKAFAASSMVVGLFLIGGWIAYQRIPNVAVKVASAKSGVHGSVPSYHPAGFGMSGPINFKPGEIKLNYQSTTDERNFQVTQRASDWNNDALLKNFVTVENRQYQTLQKNDKTIYIYDGGSATWVDRGVWYQVESKANLSSDQLIRIAESL